MRRARLALAASAASAVCLLAAGCGDEESAPTERTGTQPPSVSTEAGTTDRDRADATSGCDAGDCVPDYSSRLFAKDTVESYFRFLAEGDTDAAWNLLSPEVREQFGGFDTWSLGIEQRESTELASLTAAGEAGGRPSFDVEVRTVESTPCGISVDRTFSGPWTVDPETQLVASVDQTLVSGPPDLETVCATGGY